MSQPINFGPFPSQPENIDAIHFDGKTIVKCTDGKWRDKIGQRYEIEIRDDGSIHIASPDGKWTMLLK